MRGRWLRRYEVGARWYDAMSLERPVYRGGRAAAVGLLALHPGDRLLDVGCGTGLNFPLVEHAVGPDGSVVGVDASAGMLERARARVARRGWANVTVAQGDAGNLTAVVAGLPGTGAFDAALFTYSLSVIDRWTDAWGQTLALLRPGGRVAVADLSLPVGAWRVLSPLARAACVAGGADPRRHPWELVLGDLVDTAHLVLRGGHVHAAGGTLAGHGPGAARG